MHGEHYQIALLAHIKSHLHTIVSVSSDFHREKTPSLYMVDVAACIHITL